MVGLQALIPQANTIYQDEVEQASIVKKQSEIYILEFILAQIFFFSLVYALKMFSQYYQFSILENNIKMTKRDQFQQKIQKTAYKNTLKQ